MKHIKYFAGLIDADGSFDFSPHKLADGRYRVWARVCLYQKDQPDLLSELGKHFDMNPYMIERDQLGCLALTGKKALRFIEHLRSHLVIKRPVADFVARNNRRIVTKEELKSLKQELKDLRKEAQPERNFPARQWMAGYIDGDGCIISQFNKRTGGLEFRLCAVSHESQLVGLELIKKCFGGRIHREGDSGVMRYQLTLTPMNIEKLSYFGKHMRIKHEQYKFIHDVLSNRKHYIRNGGSAENNLKMHRELQSIRGTRND